MAQERTLGLGRALDREHNDSSKEELQRRMDEARDSISHTVTEIKETVAQQVETVKDALDWREHFKKQPLAWSLGAMGVGFLTGYAVAAALRGEQREPGEYETSAGSAIHAYAAQPILGESQAPSLSHAEMAANGGRHRGPGLFERFKETSAYDRLKKEVDSLGDRVIEELSTTAQRVVLPALLAKIKHWIALDLAEKDAEQARVERTGNEASRASSYAPIRKGSS